MQVYFGCLSVLVAEYALDHTDGYAEVIQYRTPFKKVYYGTVQDFGGYLRGFSRKIGK
jgi:hypothetical protein